MKIVFLTSEQFPVPPVRGGAVEQWIYAVAKRLRGHDVYSLCCFDEGLKDYTHNEGFKLFMYKKGLIGKILLCTYKLPFKKYSSVLYYLPYSFWAGAVVKKLKADIVHIHSRPHFVPVIRWLSPKTKIVLHVHNISVIEIEGKLWPQSLFDKVDQVACCSDYLKTEIVRRYPFLKGKVRVIYNGVDMEFFTPANANGQLKNKREQYKIKSDDIVVGFAGRLVEYKGAHVLIEAFKKLLVSYPNLRLFIIGGLTYSRNEETPYIQKLKKMCQGFEDRITFTGFVDLKEIPVLIGLSDIFVVPSLWEEPFGVIVIEAMAMGKPVIAFAKGGIKEIIMSDNTGRLVSETTAEALANTMAQLIKESPEKRQQLGARALRHVQENFAWPKIISDVELNYKEVCRG